MGLFTNNVRQIQLSEDGQVINLHFNELFQYHNFKCHFISNNFESLKEHMKQTNHELPDTFGPIWAMLMQKLKFNKDIFLNFKNN
jgi:hypothetical protein